MSDTRQHNESNAPGADEDLQPRDEQAANLLGGIEAKKKSVSTSKAKKA